MWVTAVILSHIFVLGYGPFFVDALMVMLLAVIYLSLTRPHLGSQWLWRPFFTPHSPPTPPGGGLSISREKKQCRFTHTPPNPPPPAHHPQHASKNTAPHE